MEDQLLFVLVDDDCLGQYLVTAETSESAVNILMDMLNDGSDENDTDRYSVDEIRVVGQHTLRPNQFITEIE